MQKSLRAVWAAAALVMLLTSLPYLRGWSLQGSDAAHAWYSGLPAHNVPDNAVYWAWLRAARDGAVMETNAFTTRPQSGLKLNVYYAAAGRLAGALGLGPRAFFHVSRVVLGLLLLRALWWLAGLFLEKTRARWLAWLCACSAAGLGWLWDLLGGARPRPTDLWQPEGFTPLSLYWSPHLLFPLLLMVGVFGWLTVAQRRRSFGAAALAGLCGLLLADVHTYDLVPLALGWLLLLCARGALERRLDGGAWARALLAAGVAAPGLLYMAWVLRADAVFALRAAVLTVSPPPQAFLVGYGGLLGLAAYGAARLPRESALPLACWAAGSFLAAYLPVPFQRKLLMGVHVPLALLAGAALDRLLRRDWAAGAAVAGLSVSSVLFLARDSAALAANAGPVRAYLTSGERAALAWLEAHAAPGDAVQPLPVVAEPSPGNVEILDATLAHYVPGLTGLRVHCGHVGETPSYREALYAWAVFPLPRTSEAVRRALLAESGARWLVVSSPGEGPAAPLFARPPSWLRRVPEASGPETAVFEVLPLSSAGPRPGRRRGRAA